MTSILLFFFSIAKAVFFSANTAENTAVLLLCIAVFLNSCELLPKNREPHFLPSKPEKGLAWILLFAVFIMFAFGLFSPNYTLSGFLSTLPVLLLFLAAFCFWGGFRTTLIFLLPVLLCTMILPNRETIFLMLSYPLRLLSTILSVESLRACGFALDYHLTSIRLPDSGIAITDACSGIEQLEILLLLGYLMVKIQHTSKLWAFLHYLFILPSIIFVNTIRIIVTILLFHFFGQLAFTDSIHRTLGYLLVIAVVLLLWILGSFFPDAAKRSKTENSRALQADKPAEQEHGLP